VALQLSKTVGILNLFYKNVKDEANCTLVNHQMKILYLNLIKKEFYN